MYGWFSKTGSTRKSDLRHRILNLLVTAAGIKVPFRYFLNMVIKATVYLKKCNFATGFQKVTTPYRSRLCSPFGPLMNRSRAVGGARCAKLVQSRTGEQGREKNLGLSRRRRQRSRLKERKRAKSSNG